MALHNITKYYKTPVVGPAIQTHNLLHALLIKLTWLWYVLTNHIATRAKGKVHTSNKVIWLNYHTIPWIAPGDLSVVKGLSVGGYYLWGEGLYTVVYTLWFIHCGWNSDIAGCCNFVAGKVSIPKVVSVEPSCKTPSVLQPYDVPQ